MWAGDLCPGGGQAEQEQQRMVEPRDLHLDNAPCPPKVQRSCVSPTRMAMSSSQWQLLEAEPTHSGNREPKTGTSLAVQWLGLTSFHCCGPGFNPWGGTKEPTSCAVKHNIKQSTEKGGGSWLP